jgi:hypothetical protein
MTRCTAGIQRCIRRNYLLEAAGQEVAFAVPCAHLGASVFAGLGFGGVPPHGLLKRDVQVKE